MLSSQNYLNYIRESYPLHLFPLFHRNRALNCFAFKKQLTRDTECVIIYTQLAIRMFFYLKIHCIVNNLLLFINTQVYLIQSLENIYDRTWFKENS
jgi:hypothetical protein